MKGFDMKDDRRYKTSVTSKMRRSSISSFIDDAKVERRMVRERKRNLQTVRRAGKHAQLFDREILDWEPPR